MKKIIEIEGIHCFNCAEKIENALYGLPEVEEVKVDYNGKNAEVLLSSNIDDELLSNLIQTAGHFSVKNIKEI
ncbi:heavy-metal-associated domain-containing protein [Leptotrichia sp. OH3620_COT-345]|uniref:heavy-metal-associated domain-containing protein n=1 Tax=Leptotrichia sp. OH3620_COT-345 TaxID=2491048 RepID=UPI000F650352|nr:heavy metal-associated domain-containing protein [Leptotrichia sp. OH3620_COT-345]RRD39298.1 heavy-metal-associated domain-containing protein [Leptotrichia sp. OH3620_COT-345]